MNRRILFASYRTPHPIEHNPWEEPKGAQREYHGSISKYSSLCGNSFNNFTLLAERADL